MYLYFKMLHIVALIAWLGPACGAFWILVRMGRMQGFSDQFELEEFYQEVILIEHVAFIFLIGSGVGMLYSIGFDAVHQPWLMQKLYLVGIIFFIEIFDVWISHVSFARARKKFQIDPHSAAWSRWLKKRRVFYFLTIPLIAGLSLAIIDLAVLKPG